MTPDIAPQESHLLRLTRWFQNFIAHTSGVSPLYTWLTQAIAADEELLELAAHTHREPVPNILFGAVHYLLLKGAPHPLAAYYPSIAGDRARIDDPVPAFKAFCMDYRADIIHLMQTRLVQTNEVNRCALLLPAFGLIAWRESHRRLALVEIGTSAGFNLFWDHYYYDYGHQLTCGSPDAPLRLTTELRGELRPPIPARMPAVGLRRGLDLNPIDVRDEEAALWLRALVWPEHFERAARLQQAIDLVQQHSPDLLAGDALETLPDALAPIPHDQALCVYHSFVINQFSQAQRDHLTALLAQQSAARTIYRISIEWLSTEHPQLELRVYQKGAEIESRVLAWCDPHARWMQWLEMS